MTGMHMQVAKNDSNPIDYRMSYGAENKYSEVLYWNEREADTKYNGFDGVVHNTFRKDVKFEGYYRKIESRDMLRGGITLSRLFAKHLELGVEQSWDHMEPAIALHTGLKFKFLKADLNIYQAEPGEGSSVESAKVKSKFDVQIYKRLYGAPSILWTIDRKRDQYFSLDFVATLKARKR